MRFKNFEIRKCTFVGDPPTPDYHKWNFDLVSGRNTEKVIVNIALASDTWSGIAESLASSLEVADLDTLSIVRMVLRNGCSSGAS